MERKIIKTREDIQCLVNSRAESAAVWDKTVSQGETRLVEEEEHFFF